MAWVPSRWSTSKPLHSLAILCLRDTSYPFMAELLNRTGEEQVTSPYDLNESQCNLSWHQDADITDYPGAGRSHSAASRAMRKRRMARLPRIATALTVCTTHLNV
jgi:hypothetical protein